MDKAAIRAAVRERLLAAGVIRFPDHPGRVPNFAGSEAAVGLLRRLPLWKQAAVVKADLTASTYALRRAAIADGKILYVAVPGLHTDRCFIEVSRARLSRRAAWGAGIRGAGRLGRFVDPLDIEPIDLWAVGSVGVSLHGSRLGSGRDHTDLEYGLLRLLGKIADRTLVVSIVHPLQVVHQQIPMRTHDVPADLLAMPHKIVTTPGLYVRPKGILWNLLTEEQIRAVPALRRERSAYHEAPSPQRSV